MSERLRESLYRLGKAKKRALAMDEAPAGGKLHPDLEKAYRDTYAEYKRHGDTAGAKKVQAELMKFGVAVDADVECEKCHGEGYRRIGQQRMICATCGGSGKTKTGSAEDAGDHETYCPRCDGTGVRESTGKKCPNCDGTGKLRMTVPAKDA